LGLVKKILPSWSVYFFGGFFLLAGLNQLLAPDWFSPLLPPKLQGSIWLIVLCGILMMVSGLLVLFRVTRRLGAWALFFLLILLLPVNLFLVQTKGLILNIPAWNAWLRLPLQFVLILWSWYYTGEKGR
jgi:uncharacterized membrane protein